jgi:hypothetical protein
MRPPTLFSPLSFSFPWNLSLWPTGTTCKDGKSRNWVWILVRICLQGLPLLVAFSLAGHVASLHTVHRAKSCCASIGRDGRRGVRRLRLLFTSLPFARFVFKLLFNDSMFGLLSGIYILRSLHIYIYIFMLYSCCCWKRVFHFESTAFYSLHMPITVAARTKTWTVFSRSEPGIVVSNLTQGMDVCARVKSVFVLLCV